MSIGRGSSKKPKVNMSGTGGQVGCHNIFIINLCKEMQNEKEDLLHFVSTFVLSGSFCSDTGEGGSGFG